jgi:ribA/ribD-fused uncharacterized protein
MASIRKYPIAASVVFHKTTAAYGGLSNMAAGFSLNVNDVVIATAEHLYQACRFPEYPQLQWDILTTPSPMTAKWTGRKHLEKTRSDWDDVRFKIMQWALELKLSQNWEAFSSLLLSTEDKPIVELSPKDKIWGAVKIGDQLVGVNALGRLLMLTRETFVKPSIQPHCVEALKIPDFLLLGHPIELVCNDSYYEEINWSLSAESLSI